MSSFETFLVFAPLLALVGVMVVAFSVEHLDSGDNPRL
jgi:hypothetical protein